MCCHRGRWPLVAVAIVIRRVVVIAIIIAVVVVIIVVTIVVAVIIIISVVGVVVSRGAVVDIKSVTRIPKQSPVQAEVRIVSPLGWGTWVVRDNVEALSDVNVAPIRHLLMSWVHDLEWPTTHHISGRKDLHEVIFAKGENSPSSVDLYQHLRPCANAYQGELGLRAGEN